MPSGSAGGGGQSGDATPSSLATTMEEDGSNSNNADVLARYLDGADLLVDAPEPITTASITSPVSSVVFNSNFSRERYGRAAVQSPVSLDSDKKSLLLDGNQTSNEKALAFIACLEFDSGLTVLQNNFSDSDVTSQTQPDLDKFDRYPESMFNNATELNSNKETFVFDAIDASKDATAAFTSYQ